MLPTLFSHPLSSRSTATFRAVARSPRPRLYSSFPPPPVFTSPCPPAGLPSATIDTKSLLKRLHTALPEWVKLRAPHWDLGAIGDGLPLAWRSTPPTSQASADLMPPEWQPRAVREAQR